MGRRYLRWWRRNIGKLNRIKADRLLTILAIIFFVVVVAMVCLLIFLSTGGSNKSKQMSGFYNGILGWTEIIRPCGKEQTRSQPRTALEKWKLEEGTITVQAGEGEELLQRVPAFHWLTNKQIHLTCLQDHGGANPGDVKSRFSRELSTAWNKFKYIDGPV